MLERVGRKTPLRDERSASYASEILTACWWGAKSKEELVEFTGASERFVNTWVAEYHKSGLIYVHHVERLSRFGHPTHFYARQPERPFGLPDNLKSLP